MALSTTLAQDLASNGYVVVSVDPTLGTEDRSRLPADTANPARRLDQVTAALNFATGPHIAAVAGPVDPSKLAVGGHSIAGAIAFQTSLADPRVHAVFELDGWRYSGVSRIEGNLLGFAIARAAGGRSPDGHAGGRPSRLASAQ